MSPTTEQPRRVSYRYPLSGLALLVVLVVVGTLGFMIVEDGFTPLEAFYMTVITISTVGFGEVHDLTTAGRILVLGIIISGVGLVTYTVGAMVNIIIEGRFRELIGRRHMRKELEKIKNHYIVCGYGRMGQIICEELLTEKRPFVVIDLDQEDVDAMHEMGVLALQGDATDDDVLRAAGVERARSLVAAVTDDVSNLYITLSAREMRPDLYILARATNDKASKKILHAGADRAISPYRIGGQRLVQALLRPTVYDFMETITSHQDGMDLRVEEVKVGADCRLTGKRIRETDLRQEYDLIIIGLQRSGGEKVFNPGPEEHITVGDTLIMLGSEAQLLRLQEGLDD